MWIWEVRIEKIKRVIISETEAADFSRISKKKFSFNWKEIRSEATIYKLQTEDEEEILGLIALIDWPLERRIEIKLLEKSKENIGKNMKYDRIAGCLLAFAGLEATKRYLDEACLSLFPKTQLISHYTEKYQMQYGGRHLYLEGTKLNNLINEYS